MKVKIFYEYDKPCNRYGYCKIPLEKRVNDFIKNKVVIDIKYQVSISSYATANFHDTDAAERVLVMYEDVKQVDVSKYFSDTEKYDREFVKGLIARTTIHDFVKGVINKNDLIERYKLYKLNPE